ncbi:Gmad2 immunoglobulin-like domain-containing protein [Nocardioides sp. W7]|uniref:Gmad2 immunoglobulin-like domain-containing protein n=1 Tax=Nocardioides sp. W7 TaxID=2931390 RepID=UPI001FD4B66B|nr:Gmad2 immunoglobulin-like domain-containing protein [Nocardioides sp. W7]
MTALPRRTRVAALALTAALGTVLSGCGSDDGSEDPVATDPVDSSTEATPGDPETGSATESAPPSGEVTVPVYFVGDTPQGARLFREFRKVASDNPLEEAAALVAAGDALDPDYRTAYPSGSFASIEYADGGFRVELPDDAWTTTTGQDSSEEATLAVQQLVYTLQGVQQDRAPVTVFVGDSPATLFGVDTAGGVSAEPPLDVLGLVSVTSPEEGATVPDTFTASGVASSFEATVPWEIRQGDKVVLDGFATAEGWMDKLYPWETEVDVSGLAPGEYTFVALTDDPSGGAEGAGPHQDSKAIVVE